ncbi:hypothetical protein ES332_D08G115900v1 [Gossypium tomentosum]|uniref:Uncharacterized protein n=1 Tax=Gossypium tomentosum TaxID=34277 RepID=A0A5D2JTS4_GOSTO|nr:hypothetical protein ES332_D08G115900v1 [Gossypium tomentosum]
MKKHNFLAFSAKKILLGWYFTFLAKHNASSLFSSRKHFAFISSSLVLCSSAGSLFLFSTEEVSGSLFLFSTTGTEEDMGNILICFKL